MRRCAYCVLILLLVTPVLSSFAQEPRAAGTIEVYLGQNVTITLEANMTTGYDWQFAHALDENMLQLISSEYLINNPELTGSGGKQVWTFKALKPGKTNVFFRYVRPWEKNNPPQEQASFEVIIKK